MGGVSLQEEVQSHRSKGLGDAVMWRGEQSDDDKRIKVWYTLVEVVDKVRHSSRCGDTDEDVLKILIREVVTHGTPDDRKHRFSFQDDFIETKSIADIERAWCEKMNAIKAEKMTQNSPERWRGRETVWAGHTRVGRWRADLWSSQSDFGDQVVEENLVDWEDKQ